MAPERTTDRLDRVNITSETLRTRSDKTCKPDFINHQLINDAFVSSQIKSNLHVAALLLTASVSDFKIYVNGSVYKIVKINFYTESNDQKLITTSAEENQHSSRVIPYQVDCSKVKCANLRF